MDICGWKVICERFADGPERWYASDPESELRLAAATFDELVAKIWLLELGVCAA